MRGLIKPPPGMSVAYLDWSQQEFGIAAVLSGDIVMQEAYRSGDPYLALAKQSGAVPLDATKASHPAERERFKACVLAVQYGMGAESLALRINQSKAHAQALLNLHRRTYPKFWGWSDSLAEHFALGGTLRTTFGWPLNPHPEPNLRSVRNFPMQAAGAEMLRIACILLADAGIRVCAPVHDAVLIETPTEELEATVQAAQDIMRQASETVLSGFALRSDAGVVSYPHRYMDPRGRKMWEKVAELLGWAA
jgi:DNA polymerase I-like protein with 3'-5' exonuclease and polymerase domains